MTSSSPQKTTSLSSSSSSSAASSSQLMTVATCSLNQWALDFDGNLARIQQSLHEAQQAQATYRLGPELEICGYGCEDHYYELDTIQHSWESLITLVLDAPGYTTQMVCDFGMPLLGTDGCRYNCRILVYQHRIVLIRPKTSLADAGNYRESRYFTAYTGQGELFPLPFWVRAEFLQHPTTRDHPTAVPFGTATSYLRSADQISIGCESCEELWTPQSTHVPLALQGVTIIGNGSGSHHQLRKLQQRLDLIINATKTCSGGIYLYSNQRGCDGGRLYYDGSAVIVCNGDVLAQASQFSLVDVEVITATIDMTTIYSARASQPSFGIQQQQHQQKSNNTNNFNNVIDLPKDAHLLLPASTRGSSTTNKFPSKPIVLQYHSPEEECCFGPACWLWDYLRRSGASGYLLPLSGGADSSAVATIVLAMCHFLYDEINRPEDEETTTTSTNRNSTKKNPQVLQDLRRICGYTSATSTWRPASSKEIATHIFHTIYMGTVNSSHVTTSRAQRLSASIGSYHLNVPIDAMVSAVLHVFAFATQGLTPQFVLNGGTTTEDVALQNIQARLRMVTAYLFAQLLPWVRRSHTPTQPQVGNGFLLVLGSANVDEGLRGYMTKYDCSSADLNPIGAISKGDLKAMLEWAAHRYQNPILHEIAAAPPTAELRPMVADPGLLDDDAAATTAANGTTAATTASAVAAEHSQLDEDEMGMSYDELGWFGRLRKLDRCGPVSMYQRLYYEWSVGPKFLRPTEIATKVKRFFYYYAINRHKMCTLTPSYHAEGYSPDDNRYDLRPFLYNTKWTRQFQQIDALAQQYEDETNTAKGTTTHKFMER